MAMKKNLIIVAVVVVVIIAALLVFWRSKPQEPEVVTPQPEVLNTYASSTLGVSLSYPQGFSVNESYTYDQFGPKKPIHGVKFTIPAAMATGTNLGTDTGISVETLPRAKNCTGDIYLYDNVTAHQYTEGGITYSIASSTGAGAGNRYEETVYAFSTSSPCTAIRYFIHYGVIDNYPDTVKEFDRNTLVRTFDTIRRSVSFMR